jgi:hypothetical protein
LVSGKTPHVKGCSQKVIRGVAPNHAAEKPKVNLVGRSALI